MIINDFQKTFCQSVCEQIELVEESTDRFKVFTPFHFDDGDHLLIVLKKDKDSWVLSDEGHTYMHLACIVNEFNLLRYPPKEIIDNALSEFSISDRYGELVLEIDGSEYGDALYRFVQGLLRISDIFMQ